MTVGRSPGLDALGSVAVDQGCMGAAVIEVSYTPSSGHVAGSRQVKRRANCCRAAPFARAVSEYRCAPSGRMTRLVALLDDPGRSGPRWRALRDFCAAC